jgi:HEAT repeat protein
MKKRFVRRVFFPAALLIPFGVLIPGTPFYLADLLTPKGQHGGRSASAWISALDSTDSKERRQAIFALGAIGDNASEAVPALAAILRDDPNADLRVQAALALSKMERGSREAVPALAAALSDSEPFVRAYAATAMLQLGTAAQAATAELATAAEDESNQTNLETFQFTIQETMIRALGKASAGRADAVATLTRLLQSEPTDGVRLATVRALGAVGPEARTTVPLLRGMLATSDSTIRHAIADSLEKIAGRRMNATELAEACKEMELSEKERQYIWEIEHHGNLLTKRGFSTLAGALKDADAARLTGLLSDDFAGIDLGQPQRVRSSNKYAEVERLDDSGQPGIPLDRAAFANRLLQLRKLFTARPPQVKFALMTLGPKRRGQLDGAWEGTALLRMHGEHARGAPAEVVVMLRYSLSRPTNETLSGPGWLRGAEVLQVLTAKSPEYLFAEVARQRGLDTNSLHDNWKGRAFHAQPGGVYVCDFDRDGILDVLITDVDRCWLYRGRADGRFEDVTDQMGLPRNGLRGSVAAWVDLDGDGWEDLILAGKVYRNEAGKHFTDYSRQCDLRVPRDATGVIVADYDRDAKLDLYVTRAGPPGGKSWLDGKSDSAGGNILYRNKGNWQFEDVTRASNASGGRRSTFTAAWLDVNNDGWPDLHVANEFGDGVLLVNNRNGTFSPRRLGDRPADFGTMGVAVGDINNDGNIDIYCANMYSKAGTRVMANMPPDAYPPDVMEKIRRFVAGSQLHVNRGGLKFEQTGSKMQLASVGWAYGACLADLDNDGWLDVYATAGFVSRSRDEPDG